MYLKSSDFYTVFIVCINIWYIMLQDHTYRHLPRPTSLLVPVYRSAIQGETTEFSRCGPALSLFFVGVHRKILYKSSMFHRYVGSPEGKWTRKKWTKGLNVSSCSIKHVQSDEVDLPNVACVFRLECDLR